MKYLFFMFTTVLMTFICRETTAQISSNTLENTPKLSIPDSVGVVQINSNREDRDQETNLTPEQQGFTKFILPSGEVVYRKEESGIMIEYRPKNNL